LENPGATLESSTCGFQSAFHGDQPARRPETGQDHFIDMGFCRSIVHHGKMRNIMKTPLMRPCFDPVDFN
jgi:hypothetical protein